MMSAKSDAMSIAEPKARAARRSDSSGAMMSCMPLPTKRSRRIDTEFERQRLGAGIAQEERRREVVDRAGKRGGAAAWPSIVRRNRERKRVSSAKNPCVFSTTSPTSSQIAETSRPLEDPEIGQLAVDSSPGTPGLRRPSRRSRRR